MYHLDLSPGSYNWIIILWFFKYSLIVLIIVAIYKLVCPLTGHPAKGQQTNEILYNLQEMALVVTQNTNYFYYSGKTHHKTSGSTNDFHNRIPYERL